LFDHDNRLSIFHASGQLIDDLFIYFWTNWTNASISHANLLMYFIGSCQSVDAIRSPYSVNTRLLILSLSLNKCQKTRQNTQLWPFLLRLTHDANNFTYSPIPIIDPDPVQSRLIKQDPSQLVADPARLRLDNGPPFPHGWTRRAML